MVDLKLVEELLQQGMTQGQIAKKLQVSEENISIALIRADARKYRLLKNKWRDKKDAMRTH